MSSKQRTPVGNEDAHPQWMREAMRLQEIEGNPLNAEQVAMFEMFERENWTQEQRIAHIRKRALQRAAGLHAAE